MHPPALVGPLFVTAMGLVGWRLAQRIAPDDDAGTRAARAGIFAYAAGLAWSDLAVRLGMFHLWAALLTSITACIALRSSFADVADAASAGVARIRSLERTVHLTLGLWTLAVVLSAARQVRYPPFRWDTLTYHGVLAARVIGDGSLHRDPSPDAWSYYDRFPVGGDRVWSWFMLGDGSFDFQWIAILITIPCVLAAVALAARAFGHDDGLSLRIALTVLSVPAAVNYFSSMYVDILLLGCAASTAHFAYRAIRDAQGSDGFTAAVAVATAMMVKASSLLWGVLLLLVVARLWRRVPWTRLAALGLPFLLLMPTWIDNTLAFHNPLYPMGLPALGGGNELLATTIRGGTAAMAEETNRGVVALMMLGKFVPTSVATLAPAGLWVVPFGLLALVRGAKDWQRTFVLVVVCLPSLYVLASPATRGLMTVWAFSTARLLLPGFMALAIAFPTVLRDDLARALLTGAALGGLVWSAMPFLLEATPSWDAIGSVTVFGALIVGALVSRHRVPAAVAGALWLTAVAPLLRPSADVWEHVPRGYKPTLKGQPVQLWSHLAEAPPAVIAVEAPPIRDLHLHWGHNIFRYPLLGRYAQHRLTHVSAWDSGVHRDTHVPPPADDTLNLDLWEQRLVASDVTHVLILDTALATASHAAQSARFEPVFTDPSPAILYEVQRP